MLILCECVYLIIIAMAKCSAQYKTVRAHEDEKLLGGKKSSSPFEMVEMESMNAKAPHIARTTRLMDANENQIRCSQCRKHTFVLYTAACFKTTPNIAYSDAMCCCLFVCASTNTHILWGEGAV